VIQEILYHVMKIVRSIRSIVERIDAGSEVIAEDAAHVRELIANGSIFSRLLKYIKKATSGRSSSGSKRKKRAED